MTISKNFKKSFQVFVIFALVVSLFTPYATQKTNAAEVEVASVKGGSTQISLFKDSTNEKVNFTNVKDFYLENKKTGKIYRDGKIPNSSSKKNQYEMKNLPAGEYTVHAQFLEGLSIYKIELGEGKKKTVYNPNSNPLVIKNGGTSNMDLIIKANNTLKEILPLEDLTVSNEIKINEFKAALPKFTTIVDSAGNSHQVDLTWNISQSNFNRYKKTGTATLTSESFTLPLNVTNTNPATRLVVKLNVIFKELVTIKKIVTPEKVKVEVGDVVELPKTVTAIMSNGEKKEVPIVWNPSTINTSSAGTKTAKGTVEGYKEKVIYTVEVKKVQVGKAQISLYNGSTSSNDKVDFTNVKEFYLVNKKTGKIYRDGKTPNSSSKKNQYEMKNLPVGEYTVHAQFEEGLSIYKIELGEGKKKTVYNPNSSPLVIKKDGTSYMNIIIKANNTLKEILPLEDLTVSKDIKIDEFKAALPKFTTIVDTAGNTHQVDLKWNISRSNFNRYKKPGTTTLTSESFTLPLSVSNTVPATRLVVKLNVIFKDLTSIQEIVTPEKVTVEVGDEVELPKTVTAILGNGEKKEVAVVWNPSTIDTSSVGTKTAEGTVKGYEGKVIFTVEVKAVQVGKAQISLFKDSTSSFDKVDFTNVIDFYLVNKKTGKIYRDGKTPSSSLRKNQYEMTNLPVGEYTVHAQFEEGLFIYKIEIGEAYKETIYDPELNPLVIKNGVTSYMNLVIKADNTLKEILPLEDLTVSNDITIDEFKAALPKLATIVDSTDNTHQVDIKWDIRPFNFDSYKKPGTTTLTSEFFTLPLSVSNTDPATRLEVKLNVIFKEKEDENSEEQLAMAAELVNKAKAALVELDTINNKTTERGFSKADADNVQQLIEEARTYVTGLLESIEKTGFLAELEQIEATLNEKVNARYVYYDVVKEETNINQLKIKVSADFWKAGNIERLAQNKAIIVSKTTDGAVLIKYSTYSWNTPEAGDKWETTFRFNGGVRTLALILTNNGDGTWSIESDWLVENPKDDDDGDENSEEQLAIATELVNNAKAALVELDTINYKTTYERGFSKTDVDNVQQLIDNALAYVNGLLESTEKSEFLSELEQIQVTLNEKVNARYVYYDVVEAETNIDQLKIKVSADFWTAGNIVRLAQNKAILISKTADGAVLVKYLSAFKPEAGDKWETTFRFNGGVRTLALILTNNGDGTWAIESDWLVENFKDDDDGDGDENSEEQLAIATELVNNAKAALVELDTINYKTTYDRGFSKADADNVQQLIDNALAYVNGLLESTEKSGFLSELEQIQVTLNEKVNARYVYYEVVKEETNIDQLKIKVSADFWTAGNIVRLAQNKAILISKTADGAVLVKYLSAFKPEAGDKWETTFRFNGGVRTLALILTNNGDDTWAIESDWLVEK